MGGSAFDVETAPNGEAILRHLKPGQYNVHCSHESYGEGSSRRRYQGGEQDSVKVLLVRNQ